MLDLAGLSVMLDLGVDGLGQEGSLDSSRRYLSHDGLVNPILGNRDAIDSAFDVHCRKSSKPMS